MAKEKKETDYPDYLYNNPHDYDYSSYEQRQDLIRIRLNKQINNLNKEKMANKKEQPKDDTMEKFWHELGRVSLVGLAIIFGLTFGIGVLISFITWDFSYFTGLLKLFVEEPNIIRGIVVAVCLVFTVVAAARSTSDSDSDSSSTW